MNRLDDELRRAFRREDPSPDFAARVMKAVAAAPAPKRVWWRELLDLLATPRGRWITVGAAVSVLALILATQFIRLEQGPLEKTEEATHVNQPATPGDDRKNTVVAHDPVKTPEPGDKQPAEIARPKHHHRVRNEARRTTTNEVAKSEGEIAKDQLMLALHIASASLNEAQRVVRAAEGDQPHTVAR